MAKFKHIEFIDGPRNGNNLKLGKSYTAEFMMKDIITVPHLNEETGKMDILEYARVEKKNASGQIVPTNEYKYIGKVGK